MESVGLGGCGLQWCEVFRSPEVLGKHNVQVVFIALEAIGPLRTGHEIRFTTVDQVY